MNPRIISLLPIAVLVTACHKNKPTAPPVAPPPTAQRQVKPRRTTPPTATAPAATQPGAPVAGTQAPRLGQMLTVDQERQYNALIDQSISNAQTSLRTIGNQRLTVEQQNSVRAIQDFIRQAGETRKGDLVGAKGLADKAQVLAKDLVQNLK